MIGSVLNVGKYKVIILDDFYENHEYDAILNECLFLSKRDKLFAPDKTNSATRNGLIIKKNHGVFLDFLYNDRNFSDILYFNRKIFNLEIVKQLANIDPIYRTLSMANRDTSLLSYYESGDHYKSHSDYAVLTVISWFNKEPKSFVGGDLFFEDDKNLMVEYKNNRVVIFPSFLKHEVTEIKIDKDKINLGFGRFSISQFINYE